MSTFQFTDAQMDMFKDVVFDDLVYGIDVADDHVKFWVDDDGKCCFIFFDDGSVVKRLGQQGVYNWYDYIK